MTKPRTLEEIAKKLWCECAIIFGWRYRAIPTEKNDAMYSNILAALREAADAAFEEAPNWCKSGHPIVHYGTPICPVCSAQHAARREEREALREKLERENWSRSLLVPDLLAWLDARSRAVEPCECDWAPYPHLHGEPR